MCLNRRRRRQFQQHIRSCQSAGNNYAALPDVNPFEMIEQTKNRTTTDEPWRNVIAALAMLLSATVRIAVADRREAIGVAFGLRGTLRCHRRQQCLLDAMMVSLPRERHEASSSRQRHRLSSLPPRVPDSAKALRNFGPLVVSPEIITSLGSSTFEKLDRSEAAAHALTCTDSKWVAISRSR